jgi:ribonuclease-3
MLPKDHTLLEKRLGYRFDDPTVLRVALTHRSYLNENRDMREHNERLEFLGDAVLELIVTDFLYHAMPDTPEGKMTSIRAALVRKENLARAARELHLGDFLFLSKGEEQTGGRENDYILANTVESVIGATYLEHGLKYCKKFIEKYILNRLDDILSQKLHRDAKSYLQELAQEKLQLTPTYKIIAEEGPDHEKLFEAGVYFGELLQGQGKGGSKRAAELKAAETALKKLGWDK